MSSKRTHCEMCGAKLEPWQKYTCSTECATRRTRASTLRNNKSPYKELKAVAVAIGRKQVIETDSDQIAIKKAIDARYGIGHDAGRSLLGTPEWDDVVKSITPLDRVPSRRAMPPLVPSRANYGGMAA